MWNCIRTAHMSGSARFHDYLSHRAPSGLLGLKPSAICPATATTMSSMPMITTAVETAANLLYRAFECGPRKLHRVSDAQRDDHLGDG